MHDPERSMTYPIPPRDPRIHVFSVSDGALRLEHQTYLSRLSEPGNGPSLAEAMGAPIDETHAEVFAVEDIRPMRLADYLTQAHDVPAEALARDATRLNALSGDVIVLAPGAVEPVEALNPRPEVTAIGAYGPAEADNAPRDLPEVDGTAQAAMPASPTAPARGNKAVVWIVLVALVLAVGVVLLL
jgi:hypothetical protein